IPLLARHFLQKSARDLGVEPKRVSDDALAYLASLPFPGNVRQLENLCNWLTVMAPAQVIEQKDLPPDLTARQETSAEVIAVSPDGAVALNGAVAGAASASGAATAAPAGVPVSVW